MGMLMGLLQAAPTWAIRIHPQRSTAIIDAVVPRAGGVLSRKYCLLIKELDSDVIVKEAPYLRLLPAFCPDRHINPDGTFCLGLGANHLAQGANAAAQWWSKLQVFLSCQETAHETRTWPDYAQLSHGHKAAEIQLKAEALALELGLHNEYKAAVHTGEDSILNICRYSDVRGHSPLQLQRWTTGKERLLVLERQRQKAVEEFWALFRNTSCCGTMNDCPLRKVGFLVQRFPMETRM